MRLCVYFFYWHVQFLPPSLLLSSIEPPSFYHKMCNNNKILSADGGYGVSLRVSLPCSWRCNKVIPIMATTLGLWFMNSQIILGTEGLVTSRPNHFFYIPVNGSVVIWLPHQHTDLFCRKTLELSIYKLRILAHTG